MELLRSIQTMAGQGYFWVVWPFVSLLIIGAAISCRRQMLDGEQFKDTITWRSVAIAFGWLVVLVIVWRLLDR